MDVSFHVVDPQVVSLVFPLLEQLLSIGRRMFVVELVQNGQPLTRWQTHDTADFALLLILISLYVMIPLPLSQRCERIDFFCPGGPSLWLPRRFRLDRNPRRKVTIISRLQSNRIFRIQVVYGDVVISHVFIDLK